MSSRTEIHTLPNGVRVALLNRPALRTAAVSVFIRSGSAHESRADNGIGHMLEHMAFKGTASRDVLRVNLDAERLGAEVNAHTDKDHTAYHMRGLAADAPAFVAMLADIVRHATFPADELERERAVILQEMDEVEDDPVSIAYQLFDHACYGLHPAAQPVIGQRRHIERFGRDELLQCVQRRYTGANVVVAAAGAFDADALLGAAAAGFGDMAAGTPNALPAPGWGGGLRTKRSDSGGQVQLVMGFPVPALQSDAMAFDLAAAAFGDGMSSPLLSELREKRGLVYHASCVTDRFDGFGQLAIEVSLAPDKLDTVLREIGRLLGEQARRIEPIDLERARRQTIARLWRDDERSERAAERAALDLFTTGRVRPVAEIVERVLAVDLDAAQAAVRTMHEAGAAVALAGALPRLAGQRARDALGAVLR